MRLLYCDICESVIKPNTPKIVLMTTKVNHTEENQVKTYDNVYEYMDAIREARKNIDTKEICPNCYQIIIDLFNLRLNGLKYIEKKIGKTLGLKVKSKKRKKYEKK